MLTRAKLKIRLAWFCTGFDPLNLISYSKVNYLNYCDPEQIFKFCLKIP